MGLASTSLSLALREVGVEEEPRGSNRGPRVDQFIQRAGYMPPVYWCLCFAYTMVDDAAKSLGIENPLPRTGSCDLLLEWARRGGHLRDKPEAGDLFLVMASEDDAVHVGFVDADNGNGTIETVEGNTNDGGSSNGYKVARRTRRSAGLKFVRFAAADTAYRLIIGSKSIDLINIAGLNHAPVRDVTVALGVDDSKLAYDASIPGVTWDQKVMPATPELRNGKAYLPVRALAKFFGAKGIEVDDSAKTIKFVK